ncbi:TPA: hypothetical protein ACH3X1_001487 [Trebouxia sp. C0004]
MSRCGSTTEEPSMEMTIPDHNAKKALTKSRRHQWQQAKTNYRKLPVVQQRTAVWDESIKAYRVDQGNRVIDHIGDPNLVMNPIQDALKPTKPPEAPIYQSGVGSLLRRATTVDIPVDMEWAEESGVIPEDDRMSEAAPSEPEEEVRDEQDEAYEASRPRNEWQRFAEAKWSNNHYQGARFDCCGQRTVSTLSDDPSLAATNQNTQDSLDFSFQTTQNLDTMDERNPPWHPDRINQFALPLYRVYNSSLTGVGVHIYMIDTGIQSDHVEFLTAYGSRLRVVIAEWSFDGTNTENCNGHWAQQPLASQQGALSAQPPTQPSMPSGLLVVTGRRTLQTSLGVLTGWR